jgi:hypothetical protein
MTCNFAGRKFDTFKTGLNLLLLVFIEIFETVLWSLFLCDPLACYGVVILYLKIFLTTVCVLSTYIPFNALNG